MARALRNMAAPLLALSLALALTGCGGSNSPEGIVKKMLAAAKANDTEAVIACYEPNARPVVKSLLTLKDALAGAQGTQTPSETKVKSVQTTGDTAVVVAVATREGATQTATHHCIKIDGTWYLTLGTREQMGAVQEGLKGIGDAMREGAEGIDKISESMKDAVKNMGNKEE